MTYKEAREAGAHEVCTFIRNGCLRCPFGDDPAHAITKGCQAVASQAVDAALSAFSAAGWELTRKDPTDEMKKAGSQEWGLIWSTDDDGMNNCLDYDGCEKVYKAMITAALKERQI